MVIIKTIIISFILVAIGLAILGFSLARTPQKTLQEKNYKAEVHLFYILFSDNSDKDLFKISPLDDYYYWVANGNKDIKRDHLMKDANLKETRNLFKELIYILESLFLDQKKLSWSPIKDKAQITYQIEGKKEKVYISRQLKGFDPQINAIGQSITLCEGCLITNEYGLVYLTENSFNNEKLDQIQKLNLIPLVISNNQLPIGVLKLIILGSSGSKKFEVLVSDDEQVYFYEDWNILEIKTPTANKNSKITIQIVRF